jgi:hypothetical protein
MAEKTILQQIIETSPDDTPYFAALGKFVTAYAVAESGVHRLARRLLKISDEKARILFAGARIGDVISRINGITPLARVGKKDTATIKLCFEQMDLIGKKRHAVVHRFVSLEGGEFHISNAFTAKSLRNIENDVISKDELEQMYYDCWLIYGRLDRVLNPSRWRKDDANQKMWLRSAWRYKPASQETPKKQSR